MCRRNPNPDPNPTLILSAMSQTMRALLKSKVGRLTSCGFVPLMGVPKELPIEEFKEDLLAQNLPVQSVCRITNRAREPLDLVLVSANTPAVDNATKRELLIIKACLGDHGTVTRKRNKKTDGPPACVLCKTSGHTAYYLGCPGAPKRKIIIPKNNNNKNSPPPAQTAPRRASAHAVTENVSYA
ncbi:hypothetical protein EVAR_94817_1 [Eumeta japonica]|uniref:Pre-C2HC domain-containing protein n=1 Tax=Eumeta variegata TaxID=151549 RepID=A0A4C1UHA9_EUMVA|nr:hypothetical protein EVAR_94817_1 [Eumeta japonica]